jgi:formate hydrogenlyase subunit 3/multisubunit Na+/H+ antiporter MnhD subunit
MTDLAGFEEQPHKTEIQEAGYYPMDYVRTHLLSTVWSYSIAYVLLLLLIALYHFEYIMSALRLQEMRNLAIAALAVYLLMLLGCSFFTVLIYSRKYHHIQKKRRDYLLELKKLETYYSQSKEGGSE